MTTFRVFLSRLRAVWSRRADDERLRQEIETHLEFLIDENIQKGMSRPDAQRAARRAFGGVERVRLEYRDQSSFPSIDELIQDLRLGARRLSMNRAVTLVAILALALGIGVTNTVFVFVNGTRLRGLPTEHADRIVSIRTLSASGRKERASYPDFEDWRGTTASFSGIAAYFRTRMNVGDDARATEQFPGLYISTNGFRVLGVAPILGRDFGDEDAHRDAPPVAMLGANAWNNRFGGDPSVIGRTIRVNSVPTVVVGVLPEGFQFDYYAELWQPLSQMRSLAEDERGTRTLGVVGRLAGGVSLAGAQAELDAIGERLSRSHPETNEGSRPVVGPFTGRLSEDPMQMALLGAVGFVLLIACANVTNLLLTRTALRSREIALQVALGATRRRIVRQLFVENLILTAMAGVAGLILSIAGVRLFEGSVADIPKPYWVDFTLDARIVGFFLAVCALTGLLFSIGPALFAARTNVTRLQSGGRSNVGGQQAKRLSGVLVVAELALTMTLLTGAGLMVRSFFNLYRLDSVIDPVELTTMGLQLPPERYPSQANRLDFFERLKERMRKNSAVSSAAFASMVPFAGAPVREVAIENDETHVGGVPKTAAYIVAGHDYFDTLGLPIVRGRRFQATDGTPGHFSAIVNRLFVSVYFGGEDAIGRRVRLASSPEEKSQWLTIVGVSTTVRQRTFRAPEPVVYVPFRAASTASARLLVRSPREHADIISVLREEVRALDPDLALYGIQPVEQLVAQSRWPYRVFGAMASVFAVIALALATVGLFAVLASAVSQRTQEIGVRMALGATTRHVRRMVTRNALALLVAGVASGLVGALAVGQIVQSSLVHTSPTDMTTLLLSVALLILISAIACYVPARRATRLDPIEALRHD